MLIPMESYQLWKFQKNKGFFELCYTLKPVTLPWLVWINKKQFELVINNTEKMERIY